jgi:hypothetical protein
MAVTIWTRTAQQKHMSPETLEFIAREISRPVPKGKKRRVWLKQSGGEVIVNSRL